MALQTTTKRQHIQHYLQSFNFKELFRELLGWDTLKEPAIAISCNQQTYILRPLAQKGLVIVYLGDPDAHGIIPSDPTLRTIESELTKQAFQHILVYVDAAKTRQVWQWVKRGQGKVQQCLTRYYQGQSGELLAFAVSLEKAGATIGDRFGHSNDKVTADSMKRLHAS